MRAPPPRPSDAAQGPPSPGRAIARRLLIAVAVAAVVLTVAMLAIKALLAMLLSQLTFRG